MISRIQNSMRGQTHRSAPTIFKTLALLTLMVFGGCAHVAIQGNDVTAAKTLLSMKDSIIAVAVTADNLCRAGQLDPKQCGRISDIYQKAQVTYDFTAEALIAALKANNKTGYDFTAEAGGEWAVYQTYHNEYLRLFQEIYNIAIEFRLIPAIEDNGGAR